MTSQPAFQPKKGETFSKGAVNRAGTNLVLVREAFISGDMEWLQRHDFETVAEWIRAIEWWRAQHWKPLSSVASGLRYHVGKEGATNDGRVDVAQRLKRVPTIIDKLDRQPQMNLSRMADVGGVRARLPDLDSVDRVTRRLLKTWRTIERPYRDYISGPPGPQASGYRGVHLIVRKAGVRIEIQLRTKSQDAWANMVERASRLEGVDYKSGKGDPERLETFRLIAEGFSYLDRKEPAPRHLVDKLVEARNNENVRRRR